MFILPVITESISDAPSEYFSPNDYLQFYIGTSDDDVIYAFKRDQGGEIYGSLSNGARYQEDYVVAGYGDDIIYANGGDVVDAGRGNDLIFFNYTGKEAEITGGSGFDVVQVNGSITDYFYVANHGVERPGIYTEGNSNDELRFLSSVEKLVFDDAEFLFAPQIISAAVFSQRQLRSFSTG